MSRRVGRVPDHRIRWWVWAWAPGQPAERIPHTSTMRGRWGWDAECSCGWETRTGGATRSYVEGEVWWHKWQALGEEATA